MITIKNEELEFTVNPYGAEGVSLRDVKTGHEYWWHGDPAYWEGHAPILFPAVGGHWNGTYRYEGREYAMPKHGFVRQRLWNVADEGPDYVSFSYELQPDDLAIYPFPCTVCVDYRLEGRRLKATFTVRNQGTKTMFFQMGGHPGFVLDDFREDVPVSGYLRFEGDARSLLRAGEQGCTEPERYPVPMTADGLVPICVDTFANEALILDRQITAATLLRVDGTPVARVESDAPVWLFWSPQGVHAPFVCAEPWYGLCDRIGFDGQLHERQFINRLEAGADWQGGYAVDIY